MTKMNRRQQKKVTEMLYCVLRNDLYRSCWFPSLQDKSEEELLHFTLHAWRIDKPVYENAYNILCRLGVQEEVDKWIF